MVALLHGGGPGSSGEAGLWPPDPLRADHFQVYAPDGQAASATTDPYWPAGEGTQSRVDQLEAFMDTPNVPFHVIPNAGHQAQTDQPEIVAKLMIQHFTS